MNMGHEFTRIDADEDVVCGDVVALNGCRSNPYESA